MGKNKKSEPDPEPQKIIRVLGKNLSIAVTEEEKRYRNKHGPDDTSQVDKDKVKCTVCGKSLVQLLKKKSDPYVHMLLDVLICKECSSFYGDGYFSVDEDGDDKYCRWCGQGGTLYLCSTCTCAFCKKCIKQNLSRQDVKDLESDDWKCVICKPKPLFECRTVCWFLQENSRNTREEPEEKESDKGKRSSSHKTEESRGSKRKASNDLVESRSKRQKSDESRKESTGKQLTDGSTSDRKSKKTESSKHKIQESVDENAKTSTKKTERSLKRKQSDLENMTSIPTVSDPVEEIVISDDDDKTEISPKKNKGRQAKTDISKKSPSHDVEKRPKRSVTEKKKDITPEVPKKTSKKVSKTPKNSSDKPKNSNKKEKVETPTKQSRRSSRSTVSSYQDEKNKENEGSDSESHLISLDNDNSDSESENKKQTVKNKEIRSKTNTKVQKSKLPLSKDADNTVVQATGYINSAIKDVLELTVLIGNRCEKLCSRSIESDDDLLNVFGKLKHLMGGVHTNLELIEKGLDTKINEWKGVKSDITIKPDENAELETVAEVKNSADKSKVKEEEKLKPSSNEDKSKENIDVVQEVQDGDIHDKSVEIQKEDEQKKVEEAMDIDNESVVSSLKTHEAADVELKSNKNIEAEEKIKNSEVEESNTNVESEDSKHSEAEENDKHSEAEENDKNSEAEENDKNSNVEESNENSKPEDISKNTETKQSDKIVDEESSTIVDEEKEENSNISFEAENHLNCDEEQITLDESFKKESCERKDYDITESGDKDETVESYSVENNETANDDSKIQSSVRLEENTEHIEEKTDANEDCNKSVKTENSKIENSESDANKDDKEQGIQRNNVEDKVDKTGIEEDNDSESKDVPSCPPESNVTDVSFSDVTKQPSINKTSNSQENGLSSSDSGKVEESDLNKFSSENLDEVNEAKEEEKDTTKLDLNERSSEVENKIEETAVGSSSKLTEEIKNGPPENKEIKATNKEGTKQEHKTPVSKSTEKTEIKIQNNEDNKKDRDSSRSSSDRDRDHRRDRDGRDRPRSHNWGRDSYSQDRWSGGRGSWNRYDDRRPNRGSWNWNR